MARDCLHEARRGTLSMLGPWLFCSILYSMLQCYIASIRCYSPI